MRSVTIQLILLLGIINVIFGKVIDDSQAIGKALDSDEIELYEKWRDAVNSVSRRTGKSYDGGSYINGTTNRDGKFLSLFTLIQFQNKECSAGGSKGVCYTAKECSSKGGKFLGSCASGYGACCEFTATCGATVSQNCTYLVSPNYPDSYTDARTCTINFDKTDDICQLRMDFEEFTSTQPDATGKCVTDYFTFDQDRKFRYLCGNAPSNYHFYLDVKDQTNPMKFDFTTTGTAGTARKFKIKISTIPCSLRVPYGCGNYFTEDTGAFQTFNYGSGPYLADLNYSICIRKNKGKCKAKIDRAGPSGFLCPSDVYKQPLGVVPSVNAGLDPLVPYCQIPAPGFNDVLSTYTTATNGPVNLGIFTAFDANPNSVGTTSGISQTFTQQDC